MEQILVFLRAQKIKQKSDGLKVSNLSGKSFQKKGLEELSQGLCQVKAQSGDGDGKGDFIILCFKIRVTQVIN